MTWFVSHLFADYAVQCVYLEPPFSKYAMTETGIIFRHTPLKLTYEQLTGKMMIDPICVVYHPDWHEQEVVGLRSEWDLRVFYFPIDALLIHYFLDDGFPPNPLNSADFPIPHYSEITDPDSLFCVLPEVL